jgi:cephalosporin-C deacetylase-like acetyl esterase
VGRRAQTDRLRINQGVTVSYPGRSASLKAMNPYEYPRDNFEPNLQLKKTTRHWSHYLVDFPTARPTPYEKSNTVLGEYFQPKGAKNAPLVVLLHGVGDFSAIPCRMLAKALAKKGIASFVLYSVMHSSRMPADVMKRFPRLTSQEWFESHVISVIEPLQVIDWAESRDELNAEKIAVVGISFGGINSAIAMGLDKRLKAGVFIVMGGNSTKIGWETRTSDYNKERKQTKEGYEKTLNSYMEYLAEVEEKGLENVKPPQESFWIDPMTFAHLLRRRPVLMINATWDQAIPKEATIDFWKAAGEPPISWFPATHPTIWLWYPIIRGKIVRFLESAFDMR